MIFDIGKIIAVPISENLLDPKVAGIALLLPISILYVIGNFMISESPRYLLDHNMVAA